MPKIEWEIPDFAPSVGKSLRIMRTAFIWGCTVAAFIAPIALIFAVL